MMTGRDEDVWLDTMKAAARYGVSIDMLRTWKRWRTFPLTAVVREGNQCSWNVDEVDAWLRARPIHRNGRPPRWATLVGNPAARECSVSAST